ncbi:hypothetical protein L3X38_035868 [Prunus dulcis]|uniref:Uncharacterized protein n=1 Tax=Prunus dulcis TaxID=3755 RepID=A0AAD4VM20_PRUDU|nr:hypothetical protein L3X38_035868 [Prunus dulcis]
MDDDGDIGTTRIQLIAFLLSIQKVDSIPLFMPGGFLSSINERASSVCATIRSQSNKSNHGNATSVV